MGRNTKFFPFAQGIPYKLWKCKYIAPKIDYNSWQKAIADKRLILVNYGGFFECLLSTSILEALSILRPNNKLEWITDPFMKDIFLLNGIGKESIINLPKETLRKYPCPLFFNKNNNIVFFNCLNNYIKLFDYRGIYQKNIKVILSKQLFRNSMISWDYKYLPKMKQLNCPQDLGKQAKLYNFKLNKPYILVIPDITGYSEHSIYSLNWNHKDIIELSSMLTNTKYNLIICTQFYKKYHGLRALVVKNTIHNLLYLIKNCSVILSREVDFLLSAMLLGESKIISTKLKKEYSLDQNQKYLEAKNELVIVDKLNPYIVFKNV